MTRLWRSRSTALMIFVIAFSLVVAACTSSAGDTDETVPTTVVETTVAETTTTAAPETTTTAAKPGKPYGGEAIVADRTEPPTLNPFLPGGDKVVWVVDTDNMTVHERKIAVGSMRGTAEIEILEGLEGGERVVIAGLAHLSEGMKVRFWEEQE